MKTILGLPRQYLVYTVSGLVGMVGGSAILWGVGKIISLEGMNLIAGVTLGAAIGYLGGAYVGWKAYEYYRNP
jgi:hypothetical protein